MNTPLKNITTFLILGLLLAFPRFAQANSMSDKISAKNAKHFTEQFIVGGQPSESDLTVLAKNGVKVIINLRGKGEFTDFDEKAKVEALGMNYIAIPVDGAAGVNKDNLVLFSSAIANQQQAFVHCASGNRVGAMFALDAHFNHNANIEEAIALGKKAGLTRLESKVRKVMSPTKNQIK